jgi:hypothetical protein
MVQEHANSLWGSEAGSPSIRLYDARGHCTAAGKRAECPGWRYLTSLESCPKKLRLPTHPDLLAQRAVVRASDAALLEAASAEEQQQDEETPIYHRSWRELTLHERTAAFALGCCQSRWDAGTAVCASDWAHCNWAGLTAAERWAAADLGHRASTWWAGLGPYSEYGPICDACGEAPDLISTEVMWSHASQPVDYCQSCFGKLGAEERVAASAFALTSVCERAAWYAAHPEHRPEADELEDTGD